MKTSRVGRVALLLLAVSAMLGLSACVEESSPIVCVEATAVTESDPVEDAPTLKVCGDITDLDPNETTTVRVLGRGFDAEGGLGIRPPFLNMPTGVYLIFGSTADTWRPSEGAPGGSRQVVVQKWPLPEPSYTYAMESSQFESSRHQLVPMDENGDFSVEIEISNADFTNGNIGFFSYGAGGVTKADQEIFIPVTFAQDEAAA